MACPTTVFLIEKIAREGASAYAISLNAAKMRGPNFSPSSVANESIPTLVLEGIRRNHPCLATPELLLIATSCARDAAFKTLKTDHEITA